MGADQVRWIGLFVLSFFDYLTFIDIRIMNSIIQFAIDWRDHPMMSVGMLICWAVLLLIAEAMKDNK